MKQTVIKQYIRNPKNKQPRGVAVAVRKDDEVFYGYSLWNSKMDKYDKQLGLDIAMNRATNKDGYTLPEAEDRLLAVLSVFNDLEERCLKYFKDLDPDKVKLCPTNIESPYIEE